VALEAMMLTIIESVYRARCSAAIRQEPRCHPPKACSTAANLKPWLSRICMIDDGIRTCPIMRLGGQFS
jgi:hypothetical protein